MRPDCVDVVIVNWNSREQLRECLAAIDASPRDAARVRRVVVVDNASSDDSWRGLDGVRVPTTVIRNSENRGFAAACNQGAAASDAPLVLFLNPDTRVIDGALARAADAMLDPAHARTGVLGVQLVDDDGSVTRTCARFPTPLRLLLHAVGVDRFPVPGVRGHYMTDWDHASSRVVDQVMGAFFLVRRSLFEQLRGFDERFFVYFEEVDFARRAAAAGHPSYFLSDARVYHRGGGTTDQVRARRLFYMLRSRLLYAAKHFGPAGTSVVAGATLVLEPLARLMGAAVRRTPDDASETVQGIRMLWSDVPAIVRTARRHREGAHG